MLSTASGVQLNDLGDGDTGANNLQNYPIISLAQTDLTQTKVEGTFNSLANTTFTLEFFASAAADPSGFGEGETYLASIEVTTDGAGSASFSSMLPAGAGPTDWVTATATDPNDNTSEFSNALLVEFVAFITVVEAIGVSDAPVVAPSVFIVLSEGVGVGDAVVVRPPAVIVVGEAIGVADAPVVRPPAIINLAEGVGVGDAPAVAPSVFIVLAEGVGVGDAVVVRPPAIVVVGEAIGVADGPVVRPPVEVIVVEGVGVGDSPLIAPSVFIVVAEGVGVGDAPSVAPSVLIAVVEGVGVGDAPAVAGPVLVIVAEGVGVGDAPSVAPSVFIVVAEGVGVGDTPTVAPSVLIVVAEGVGIGDAPAVAGPVLVVVTEGVGVRDAPTVAPSVLIVVAEGVGVGDTPTVAPSVLIVVAEGVGIGDAPAVAGPVLVVVTEGVGVRDAPTVAPSVLIVVAEGVGVGDTPTVAPTLLIVVAEGVGIGDAPAVAGPVLVVVAEGVGVGDAPAVAPTLLIVVVEGVGVGDTPVVAPSVLIVVAEGVGVGDAPSVAPTLLLAVAEGIAVGDGVVLDAGVLIELLEAIGVADAVAVVTGAPVDDLDGIEATIDGTYDGVFTDESSVFSSGFTDQHLVGGTTFGVITDRGGLAVTVADDAVGGVLVGAVGGGGGTAVVSVCSPAFDVAFSDGDEALLTCGSLTVDVLVGPVEVDLPGGELLVVPTDAVVTIEDVGGDVSEITNLGDTPVTLLVDGTGVPIDPGGTLTTEDPDGDGVLGGADACATTPGLPDRQGCPFGDEIHVDLHIVDQQKSGACAGGAGSCKLPLEGVEVRIFDRNDGDFFSAYGKNPSGAEYPMIFDNADAGGPGPSAIAECTTDVAGTCIAGEEAPGDYLVIVKYYDAPSGKTVYSGKPKGPSDFDETGLAQKDFQIIQVIRKNGGVQFNGGSKTVVEGSFLEIVYPDFAVWEDVAAGYVYPFIFTSDSDWSVDVCTRVPHGYEITGVYDANGDFVPEASCAQAFVSGETKVLAFDVVETGSPEPQLTARLTVRSPHGAVTALNLGVPGIRVARERAPRGPFSSLPGAGTGASFALLFPVVIGVTEFGRRRTRRSKEMD